MRQRARACKHTCALSTYISFMLSVYVSTHESRIQEVKRTASLPCVPSRIGTHAKRSHSTSVCASPRAQAYPPIHSAPQSTTSQPPPATHPTPAAPSCTPHQRRAARDLQNSVRPASSCGDAHRPLTFATGIRNLTHSRACSLERGRPAPYLSRTRCGPPSSIQSVARTRYLCT